MSLINDALRRANPKPQESRPASGLGVSLQPVEYKSERKTWLRLLAGPVAVGLFGLSAWLLWTAGKPTPRINSAMDVTGHQMLPGVVAAAHDELGRAAKLAPLTQEGKAEAGHQLNTNLAASTDFAVQLPPATTAPATTQLTREVKPVEVRPIFTALADGTKTEVAVPKLKLQGIYFRRTNPSVLINGRTLFSGDRVEGARVVTIDRQTVTVEFGGQITLLTL